MTNTQHEEMMAELRAIRAGVEALVSETRAVVQLGAESVPVATPPSAGFKTATGSKAKRR